MLQRMVIFFVLRKARMKGKEPVSHRHFWNKKSDGKWTRVIERLHEYCMLSWGRDGSLHWERVQKSSQWWKEGHHHHHTDWRPPKQDITPSQGVNLAASPPRKGLHQHRNERRSRMIYQIVVLSCGAACHRELRGESFSCWWIWRVSDSSRLCQETGRKSVSVFLVWGICFVAW